MKNKIKKNPTTKKNVLVLGKGSCPVGPRDQCHIRVLLLGSAGEPAGVPRQHGAVGSPSTDHPSHRPLAALCLYLLKHGAPQSRSAQSHATYTMTPKGKNSHLVYRSHAEASPAQPDGRRKALESLQVTNSATKKKSVSFAL